MNCFACETEHPLASGERVGFRESCDRCGADLHTCRNCAHHDPSAYNECLEPGAERVADRERGNRCEWFTPGHDPGRGGAASRDTAAAALDALFKKP